VKSLTMGVSIMACVALAGCSDKREVQHTGVVKDIVIGDELSPNHLTVRAGDQVRWINQRSEDVQVAFNETVSRQISCNKDFRVFPGIGHDTANLAGGQSASLCFIKPGTRLYVARIKSNTIDGEESLKGTVIVE
jgi:plastocyanin